MSNGDKSNRIGSDLPESRRNAHRHLQELAGNSDISTIGPAFPEFWETLCQYLRQGLVKPEDFPPKKWQQLMVHARVAGQQIHTCIGSENNGQDEGGDDIIPEEEDDSDTSEEEETSTNSDESSTEETDDDETSDSEQPDTSDDTDTESKEEEDMSAEERLKSRIAEESEDDERYSEWVDRGLFQNFKTIIDAFGVGFVAEAFQDLRDYTEERRLRERAETRRLEHEDEERALRLRQEQELFSQRMQHREETFQDRRLGGQQAIRHADNAMSQQLRDQTRDNIPEA